MILLFLCRHLLLKYKSTCVFLHAYAQFARYECNPPIILAFQQFASYHRLLCHNRCRALFLNVYYVINESPLITRLSQLPPRRNSMIVLFPNITHSHAFIRVGIPSLLILYCRRRYNSVSIYSIAFCHHLIEHPQRILMLASTHALQAAELSYIHTYIHTS